MPASTPPFRRDRRRALQAGVGAALAPMAWGLARAPGAWPGRPVTAPIELIVSVNGCSVTVAIRTATTGFASDSAASSPPPLHPSAASAATTHGTTSRVRRARTIMVKSR